MTAMFVVIVRHKLGGMLGTDDIKSDGCRLIKARGSSASIYSFCVLLLAMTMIDC
jgi:hypothetical protein